VVSSCRGRKDEEEAGSRSKQASPRRPMSTAYTAGHANTIFRNAAPGPNHGDGHPKVQGPMGESQRVTQLEEGSVPLTEPTAKQLTLLRPFVVAGRAGRRSPVRRSHGTSALRARSLVVIEDVPMLTPQTEDCVGFLVTGLRNKGEAATAVRGAGHGHSRHHEIQAKPTAVRTFDVSSPRGRPSSSFASTLGVSFVGPQK
jgi:hypothetical protein